MKKLQKALTALSLVTLVFFSCKKEYSYEVPGGASNGTYQWSFTEGSSNYKGPVDTAFIDTLGTQKQLTISGHSSDNKDVISLQIFADTIQIGTYQTNRCSFDYLRGGAEIYRSDLTAIGQFTINITAIDSISITGTFSGIALDTAKKQKNITDGKFKARLKSKVASTPQTCKISKYQYTDSASGLDYLSGNSAFTGSVMNKFSLTDSSGASLPFPATYTTGKVTFAYAGNSSKPETFTVDGNGRVSGFTGYLDPLTDTTPAVTAAYTYDANGHMTKRTQTYTPTGGTSQITLTTTYTWSGDLLTQGIMTYNSLKVAQADYEYGNTTVKSFLALHPYADELFLFQSGINLGVVPAKAISKVTDRYYDISNGNVTSTNISVINNYSVDANGYVQKFGVGGDDFMAITFWSGLGLYSSTKYTLSYSCY